jgi:hypothetical protein
MCAVVTVIFVVCNSVRLLQLLVVIIQYPIQNPTKSQSYTRQYIEKTAQADTTSEYSKEVKLCLWLSK